MPGRSAASAIAGFVSELFGEPFQAQDVISESYAPLPSDLPPLTRGITSSLAAGPKTVHELAEELHLSAPEVEQSLLSAASGQPGGTSLVPKLHAFFSQGRGISACLDASGPHLNDRGEATCPACAHEDRHRDNFPMVFCRACGQEFYSAALDGQGELHPAELDTVEASGRLGYLYLGAWDQEATPLPR